MKNFLIGAAIACLPTFGFALTCEQTGSQQLQVVETADDTLVNCNYSIEIDLSDKGISFQGSAIQKVVLTGELDSLSLNNTVTNGNGFKLKPTFQIYTLEKVSKKLKISADVSITADSGFPAEGLVHGIETENLAPANLGPGNAIQFGAFVKIFYKTPLADKVFGIVSDRFSESFNTSF